MSDKALNGHAASETCSSTSTPISASHLLTQSLEEIDRDIYDIIEHEKLRQRNSLSLIPSENYTSISVLSALGSIMQNKYSEGYPHARYYGGNEFIDQAEILCQTRALKAFHLSPSEWAVNVQPHSGTPANFHVYTALLEPHSRIMSLDLPHGGHLSHGYQTAARKVSSVSIYFDVLPYRLNETTGLIDYEALEANAKLYRPKILIAGASAYSRLIDYKRMKEIADLNQSYLMSDMAHISGLVAAKVMPSPFEYSDIVTTTTHKSLRGPRGAMIFYRKGVRYPATSTKPAVMYDLEDRINAAVFPGCQGGPHNHTITALAVALKQVDTPEFVQYQQLVLENCHLLATQLMELGYKLVSNGTSNHLCLIDLREKKINGAKVERVLEVVNIAANKNTVPGDISALNPGGLRIGTPAITTRGLTQKHMPQVAQFIHRAITIALQLQTASGPKLIDFKRIVDQELSNTKSEIAVLKQEVTQFARLFPVIGFHLHEMKFDQ